MAEETQLVKTRKAQERLAKWRVLFTGWQLGTRPKGDPEGDAVRDHREVTIMLRAEVRALISSLIEYRILTKSAYNRHLERECNDLNEEYSQRFPGITTDDKGLVFDDRAVETMKGWKP